MERRAVGGSHSIIPARPQAVAATLALCAFVVLLFVGSGPPERPGSTTNSGAVRAGQPTTTPTTTRPRASSVSELRALSNSARQPVYWLGRVPGTKLELTHTTTGRTFVRYLPEGAQIGNPSMRYRFVGTYRYPGAFDAVRSASERKGAVVRRLAGGGLAVQSKLGDELVRVTRSRLPSPPVFIAYPGSDHLIEVFEPSADRALALAASGRVRPVR
jgi:hypothetical protein